MNTQTEQPAYAGVAFFSIPTRSNDLAVLLGTSHREMQNRIQKLCCKGEVNNKNLTFVRTWYRDTKGERLRCLRFNARVFWEVIESYENEYPEVRGLKSLIKSRINR